MSDQEHFVFISHAAKDKSVADAVCAALENAGIKCWVAPRDIPTGANWAKEILDAIVRSKLMVLIFSHHTSQSPHVRREIERAVHRDIPIAPLRVEDVMPEGDLEYFLSSQHWSDLFPGPIEAHIQSVPQRVSAIAQIAPNPAVKARADAGREMASVASATRKTREGRALRWCSAMLLLGVIAAALFYPKWNSSFRGWYASLTRDEHARQRAEQEGDQAQQAAKRWARTTADESLKQFQHLKPAEEAIARAQSLYQQKKDADAEAAYKQSEDQFSSATAALDARQKATDVAATWKTIEASPDVANLKPDADNANQFISEGDAALAKGDIATSTESYGSAEKSFRNVLDASNAKLEELCVAAMAETKTARKQLDAAAASTESGDRDAQAKVDKCEHDPDLQQEGAKRDAAVDRLNEARLLQAAADRLRKLTHADVLDAGKLNILDTDIASCEQMIADRRYANGLTTLRKSQNTIAELLKLGAQIQDAVNASADAQSEATQIANLYRSLKQTPSSKVAKTQDAISRGDRAIAAKDYATAHQAYLEAKSGTASILRIVPDQYAGIQAAMDAADPGDIIRIKPGTYIGNIKFKDGVAIIGAGRDDVTIQIDGDGITTDGCKDIAISSVTIEQHGEKRREKRETDNAKEANLNVDAFDGKEHHVHHFVNHIYSVVHIARGTNCVMKDCAVRNGAGFGVATYDGSTIRMEDCLVEDTDGVGVGVGYGREDELGLGDANATLDNCIIRQNASDGIGIGVGARATVQSCQVKDNKRVGIYVAGNVGFGAALGSPDYGESSVNGKVVVNDKTLGNVVLTNNVCGGNSANGIYIYSKVDGVVQKNRCENNGFPGIAVAGKSTSLSITENICTGNQQDGIVIRGGSSVLCAKNECTQNKGSGIYVEGAGTTPKLEGNSCSENGSVGISIMQAASGDISGNTCDKNKQSGILVNSADPNIHGNQCNENEYWGLFFYNDAAPTIAQDNRFGGNKIGDCPDTAWILPRDATSEQGVAWLCNYLKLGNATATVERGILYVQFKPAPAFNNGGGEVITPMGTQYVIPLVSLDAASVAIKNDPNGQGLLYVATVGKQDLIHIRSIDETTGATANDSAVHEFGFGTLKPPNDMPAALVRAMRAAIGSRANSANLVH
jgi:parallel beta-helix repeat protein